MRTPNEIDVYDEDLTTAEAAAFVQVTPDVVRQWQHRGHLKVALRDARGRPRYRALDVVKAEFATRRHGLRMRGALT